MSARVAAGVLLAALLVAPPAAAGPSDPPPAAPPAPLDPRARLESAKQLFDRGVTLLNEHAFQSALDLFSRSRELVPRVSSTWNAAICLEQLGRYDEALEIYEGLLRSFGAELTPADQAQLGAVIHALGQKVGSLQITANVDGKVIIDGRDRGLLPLVGPVRVRKTRHAVQIAKEGYAPFEMVVDVDPGAVTPISAHLRMLPGVGLLRVEDSTSEGADVFVDGRRVGAAPWEGVVDPGKHLVWTRRGSRGSAPAAILAVQGQTALARMASSALGPAAQIDASPATAEISVDGIALGSRAWEGRLPVGLHQVSVSEAGYVSESRSLMVPPSGSAEAPESAEALPPMRVVLALDPTHPRWNRRAEGPSFLKGRSFLGVFGGYAGSTSLHARLSPCYDACDPGANGVLVGLRSGYRLGLGLAPELGGGYMTIGSKLSSLRGLFVGAGMSYRAAPADWIGLLVRTTAGVLSAQTGNSARVVPAQPFFVMPEIGAEATFGGLRVGMQLGVGFFPSSAPDLDVPEGKLTPFKAFVLWVPQVGVVYSFE